MTEKHTIEIAHSPIDPGYLMVGIYVLVVMALVLLGWFGAAGAHSGTDSGLTEHPVIIQNTSIQQ